MIPIERLSVCIETVFPHTAPYQDRIREVADLGFKAYEFWFMDLEYGESGWRERKNAKDPAELLKLNRELDLHLVCCALNMPHGDLGGNFMDQQGFDRFMTGLERHLPAARELGMPFLIGFPGTVPEGGSWDSSFTARCLRQVDAALRGTGVRLLLESLSLPRYPGYALPTVDRAAALIEEAETDEVRILFDFFHVQSMTGNLLPPLQRHLPLIGHLHVAGVPGQHEPRDGEIDYPRVLARLLELEYDGWLGLEYWPLLEPVRSLGETLRYLQAR
jgi:hydroxypyruvate isomerase